ncbi:MAG: hypothetical protein LBR22_04345 [Desulfovibrio sp.]|jgi:quinol-cytochrome oxidoreductase complex cytochrome b subunit|nr:hypothetical protein [Desulfovibrio sp.]
MQTKTYAPDDATPFWPGQFLRNGIAALAAVALFCILAAYGMESQDAADPVTTSSVPQPDWLFMAFFQVTRYCQDGLEMPGVFWLPATLLAFLVLLPFLDRAQRRKPCVKWLILGACLAVFVGWGYVTYHTCSTTPLWSCPACHKEGFGEKFAVAPHSLAAFSVRHDNKWLAMHYRYPQFFWMMGGDIPAW